MMRNRITSRSFTGSSWIELEKDGITFCDLQGFRQYHRYRFEQIDCILLSSKNLLSVQVGSDIYTVAVEPNNPVHEGIIQEIVNNVRRVNNG